MFQKYRTVLKRFFQSLNSFKGFAPLILISLAGFIYSFSFFYPLDFKIFLNRLYQKKNPKTLSRLEEPTVRFGSDLRIIKLKRNNKIYLDFLLKQKDRSFRWMNSVELRGSREAYFDSWEKGMESGFHFSEAPSSLLITWNDQDQMEIIAPTFNSFFIPILNKVIYNEDKKSFELTPLFKDYPSVKAR